MKLRVLTSLVASVYLVAVAVIGAHHHHEHAGSGQDSHCAACQWHIQSNAPASAPPLVVPVLTLHCVQEQIPVSAQLEAPFLPFAHSRAPPITSA